MRNKFMSNEEVQTILQHSGLPVELPLNARPQWMNNLPSAHVFASGIKASGENWLGVEVYRDSSSHPEASSGSIYNQDIYTLVPTANGYIPSGLLPGLNHWSISIPQQLTNAPTIDLENKTE